MRYVRSLALVAALCGAAGTAQGQIVNGSFETADYTGWTLSEDSGITEFGTWGIATNGQTIAPLDLVFDFFDRLL